MTFGIRGLLTSSFLAGVRTKEIELENNGGDLIGQWRKSGSKGEQTIANLWKTDQFECSWGSFGRSILWGTSNLFYNIPSSTEVGVTTTTTHNSLHGRYSARGRAVLGRPDPCCILSSGTARTLRTLSSRWSGLRFWEWYIRWLEADQVSQDTFTRWWKKMKAVSYEGDSSYAVIWEGVL